MPWAVAAAGVGAAGSIAASNSASKGQQGAAGAATDLARSQYTDTVERNQPFLQAGTDALAMLQQKLPTLNAGYDPSKLTSEPGYQFGLQQGQQALERSLAARGRGVSGAALKAASEFGTNYGTTKLNDAFTRDQSSKNQSFQQLQALANIGQSSANNTAVAGGNFANAAGANLIGAADSAGANVIGQGNQLQGLINQGASGYKNANPGNGGVVNGWLGTAGAMLDGSYNENYGNEGRNYPVQLADGGPVRAEPRVGSRTPLPSGSGGGGLSRDAVLAVLDAAHAQGQQAASAPSALANPNNLPLPTARGLRAVGEYAAGGAIRGPGGPRDDAIPARLSDGEHVFDAESVSALGDGDNEKGQALLNELRARVKAHAAGKKGRH